MATDRLMPPDEPPTAAPDNPGVAQSQHRSQSPPWPAPLAAPPTTPAPTASSGELFRQITGPVPRGTWTVMFASALFGAILGGVITGKVTPNYEAVALVQGSPARLDPSSLSQEDDRYAQTEAAYARLAEPEITAAISERTDQEGLTAAEVSLVAGTTILRFTGSGDTAQAAADAANISAETYVEMWRARSATALTESLALVDQNLAATTDPNATASDPNAAATDTNTLLTEQRAVLDTQLSAVQAIQRVVQPASAGTAEQTAGYSTGLMLGGLAGLTLGVGVLLWRRRPAPSEHPHLDQVTP